MINFIYLIPILLFLYYGKRKYNLDYFKPFPIIIIIMGLLALLTLISYGKDESVVSILIQFSGATFFGYSIVKGVLESKVKEKND